MFHASFKAFPFLSLLWYLPAGKALRYTDALWRMWVYFLHQYHLRHGGIAGEA